MTVAKLKGYLKRLGLKDFNRLKKAQLLELAELNFEKGFKNLQEVKNEIQQEEDLYELYVQIFDCVLVDQNKEFEDLTKKELLGEADYCLHRISWLYQDEEITEKEYKSYKESIDILIKRLNKSELEVEVEAEEAVEKEVIKEITVCFPDITELGIKVFTENDHLKVNNLKKGFKFKTRNNENLYVSYSNIEKALLVTEIQTKEKTLE